MIHWQQLKRDNRFFVASIIIGILSTALLSLFIGTAFAFTLLGDREIRMGSSQPGDVNDYTVEFDVVSSGSIGGIVVTFCANSPTIGDTECEAPNNFGLTTSLANLNAGDVDLTGFYADTSQHTSTGTSDGNTIAITPRNIPDTENWSEIELVSIQDEDINTNHLLESGTGNLFWSFGSSDNSAYLYRSTNDGNSWSQSMAESVSGQVATDHLLESSAGNLFWSFGANSAYLYRSTDGGSTWSEVESVSTGGSVNTDHLLESGTGNLFWSFGSSDNSAYLYRSTDDGSTWSEVESVSTGDSVNSDSLLETSANSLIWTFASARTYVYRSVDGGSAWSEVYDTSFGSDLIDVQLIELSSGELVLSYGSGFTMVGEYALLYSSIDDGLSWNRDESYPINYKAKTNFLLESSAGDIFWLIGTQSSSSFNPGASYLLIADSMPGSPVLVSAGERASFDLVDVLNQDVQGTFYARIYTYADPEHALGYTLEDPWAGGDVIDAGGVALSTTETIDIRFMVPERLTFCIFTNELSAPGDFATCDGTTAAPISLGNDFGVLSPDEPSISKDAKYNIATNAPFGAMVRIRGSPLSSGPLSIDAIGDQSRGDGIATLSSTGVEQFGICTYQHIDSVENGIVPLAPYNHANCAGTTDGQGGGNDNNALFAFNESEIDSIYGHALAQKSAGDWSTGVIVFLANITNFTEPGIYTTTFDVIATGQY